jgi:hypothetical protein
MIAIERWLGAEEGLTMPISSILIRQPAKLAP